MSLHDTLLDCINLAPAPKNRVEALMDTLEGEDLETLYVALRQTAVRAAALTKALRREYGHDVVKDNSVAEWRRKHLTNVTGL